jgi:ribosomal protein L29
LRKCKYKHKKGWWKAMTPKELTDKTIKDIIKRRSQAKNEFYAYRRELTVKNLKKWSIRVGGCRW